MGLFSKKKEETHELPPLKFPELPKSVPSFDSGKQMQAQEANEIKQAVSPSPAMPSMPGQPRMPEQGARPSVAKMPESPGVEKPLFVKIDKYRDVVSTLNSLKSRLHEADEILATLNTIKDKEAKELAAWHTDLEKIRNQLLDIDKKLFE
jgi:hypothetical protein